ncbi:amidohydrolase family protein [Variovorax sp. J22P240]|uniref:amidohydrolase family protein n=1 Tax=Variovorax sp. J22P240 TaxID=3053514 RepID=UPI00257843A4|nr:amidohydrolase family protein [Variovorax sp. J22P240]MDM0000080.1 amidohydrolase family protein [Variovorax sp. J22P240]
MTSPRSTAGGQRPHRRHRHRGSHARRYGDHDMLDTFTQAVKILHLDHPLGDWIRAATETPAAIMGIERGVLKAGTPADLIVLKARNYSEMLARTQFDRTVLRAGRAIDTTLPDYRLLDDLMTA